MSIGQLWPEPTPVVSREQVSYMTGSLSDRGSETGTVVMAPGYDVISIETSRAARVRMYASTAHRTLDATRKVGVDPVGDHGVMMDFVTTPGMLSASVAPPVSGFTSDGTSTVPISVQNLSGGAGTVQVDLTFVRTEG